MRCRNQTPSFEEQQGLVPRLAEGIFRVLRARGEASILTLKFPTRESQSWVFLSARSTSLSFRTWSCTTSEGLGRRHVHHSVVTVVQCIGLLPRRIQDLLRPGKAKAPALEALKQSGFGTALLKLTEAEWLLQVEAAHYPASLYFHSPRSCHKQRLDRSGSIPAWASSSAALSQVLLVQSVAVSQCASLSCDPSFFSSC